MLYGRSPFTQLLPVVSLPPDLILSAPLFDGLPLCRHLFYPPPQTFVLSSSPPTLCLQSLGPPGRLSFRCPRLCRRQVSLVNRPSSSRASPLDGEGAASLCCLPSLCLSVSLSVSLCLCLCLCLCVSVFVSLYLAFSSKRMLICCVLGTVNIFICHRSSFIPGIYLLCSLLPAFFTKQLLFNIEVSTK